MAKMGLLSWSKKGHANLLFWSNEKGVAAVTFRLEDPNPGKGQWITGRCKGFFRSCLRSSTLTTSLSNDTRGFGELHRLDGYSQINIILSK
jgi:hypothetical protein